MKTKDQSGQILVLTLIILGFVTISTVLLLSNSINFSLSSKHTVQSTQALQLAEAGIDKAVASLNATGGTYNGENETALNSGSYSVTVTSINSTTKKVVATGYTPNKTAAKSKETIEIQVAKGEGFAFNYGVQVGEGGLIMSNNARVNGSVFSNGNVTMSNNAVVTGDVYVADGVQPNPDQQSVCTPPSCSDFTFGRVVNGQLDVAQSFMSTVLARLSKVALRLKKVGNPSDLTIRITRNNFGSPDRNNIVATGTLNANLVGTQYGWIEVPLLTPPNLLANSDYWIMLDTTANTSNYWMWELDALSGYNRGQAKWSPNYNVSNPTWNSISGDLGFRTYMSGVNTFIQGAANTQIQGNAYAGIVQNMSVTGGVYYDQLIQNVTAGTYNPNSTSPQAKGMPISDANIADWKAQATAAGVHTGDITNTCPATLPAGKYVGYIQFTANCTVRVGSPIWVTGILWLNGGTTVRLDPSYGAGSGVFMVDDEITMTNNVRILGTGSTGSYLMLISDRDSRTDLRPAITISNNGNSGILYAGKGVINVANNNSLTELTGWGLNLGNNVTINYDQGLSGAFFSSGPSGAFTVIKGTYQNK